MAQDNTSTTANDTPPFDVEKVSLAGTEEASMVLDPKSLSRDQVLPSQKHNTHYLYLGLAIVAVALIVALPLALIDRGSSSSKTASLESDPLHSDDGQCPGHLEGEYIEINQINFAGIHLGESFDRTFDVEPSHGVLPGTPGVIFNVETVPEALEKDLNKPILDKGKVLESIIAEANKFYENSASQSSPTPEVTMEVASNTPENLVFAGGQGFLVACMVSFAQHLPLALNAEHIWTVIANGFARHVDQYSEELRSNFVDFDGKKEIKIREDSMVRGASPPEQWEELIFPKFAQAISDNMINQDVYETL
jgi:hypothetical protein